MFKLTSNLKELTKKLNALDIKQIPFAVARSLTQTAQEIQTQLIEEELQEAFTIRKPWPQKQSKFGIKISYATPKNLLAQVFTRAPWLPVHQTGGVQKPQTSSRLAIPTPNIRKDVRKIIPKGQRPLAFKGNPRRTFFMTSRKKQDRLLFQRVGRRKRSYN